MKEVDEMPTKSIKLAISYSKDNIMNEKDFYKELRDMQYKTFKACNRAITYIYSNDMQNLTQKNIGIPKENDKILYGKSFQAWVETKMKEIMEGCLTNNVAQTRAFVFKRYSYDKNKKGLLKGEISLSNFKRDMPVIIHNKAYGILETPKGFALEIGFFNKAKQQKLGLKKIKFLLNNLGASEREIIKRLYDGSYKLGTGQIVYNNRKNKWMIAIPYTFTQEKNFDLNKDRVMGIDLGISNVATFSIFDNNKKEYVQMYYKDRAIDGTELIHYRQRIESRRKSLAIASKWASENKTGHGYRKKMKKANDIGDKYNRFKETFNHKVSKYIVDVALKYKVSLIQMEDLSGFSSNQQESLLKNWSYYDLQLKVKYKAEEKGIQVVLINPKYTSQRCSKCGYISVDNRKTQKEFKCITCGHEENADVNASKNIALIDIENLIKEFTE